MFGLNARARRNALEAWQEAQARVTAHESEPLFAAAIQAREEARASGATIYPRGSAATFHLTPGGGAEPGTPADRSDPIAPPRG